MIFIDKSVLFDNFFKIVNPKYINNVTLKKMIISIQLNDLVKLQDYLVFQSICLLDTICGQKPILNISKFRYNLGRKAISYSCKVTLRNRNLKIFLYFFNIIILPEMKRRYLLCDCDLNYSNHYTFPVNSVNVFSKLDEFYFRWKTPILMTVAYSSYILDSIIPFYINYNSEEDHA